MKPHVFGEVGAAAPQAELKTLHAKIGQLTLENDFLESALSRAGLLSENDDRPYCNKKPPNTFANLVEEERKHRRYPI